MASGDVQSLSTQIPRGWRGWRGGEGGLRDRGGKCHRCSSAHSAHCKTPELAMVFCNHMGYILSVAPWELDARGGRAKRFCRLSRQRAKKEREVGGKVQRGSRLVLTVGYVMLAERSCWGGHRRQGEKPKHNYSKPAITVNANQSFKDDLSWP